MALFRREAMEGRGQALEGAVSLAVPLSWQIVGALLFTVVAGAALFMTVARTDHILALETVVDRNGRATAILPQADATALGQDTCGAVTFHGGALSTEACVTGLSGSAPRALSSGEVVIGQIAQLRLASPAPAGARGTVRFVAGRQSIWSALVR